MKRKLLISTISLLALVFTGCSNSNNEHNSPSVSSIHNEQTATIKWDWDDGEHVISKQCVVGKMPVYDYATDGFPKKTHPDADKCYVFTGWTPTVSIPTEATTYTYFAQYDIKISPHAEEHNITFDLEECNINGRSNFTETYKVEQLPLTFNIGLPAGKFVKAYPAYHCLEVKNSSGEVVQDAYTYDQETGKLVINKLDDNLTIRALGDYACALLIYEYDAAKAEGANYTTVTLASGPNSAFKYVDWDDGTYPEKVSTKSISHTYTKSGPNVRGAYMIRIYEDNKAFGSNTKISFLLSSSDGVLSLGNCFIDTIDFYDCGTSVELPDYAFNACTSLSILNLSRLNYVVPLGKNAIDTTILDPGYAAVGPLIFVYEGLYNSYTSWGKYQQWISKSTSEYCAELPINVNFIPRSEKFDIVMAPYLYDELTFMIYFFIKPQFSSYYRFPNSTNLNVVFKTVSGSFESLPVEFNIPFKDWLLMGHHVYIKNIKDSSEYTNWFYYRESDKDYLLFDISFDVCKITYDANGGKINNQDKIVQYIPMNSAPTHPTKSTVTLAHDSDEQYNYEFVDWDRNPEVATGDQTYYAIWRGSQKLSLQITWYNYDQTIKLGTTEASLATLPSPGELSYAAYRKHDELHHYAVTSWKEVGTDLSPYYVYKDTAYYACCEPDDDLLISFTGTNVVEKGGLKPWFADSFTYHEQKVKTYVFKAASGFSLPENISITYEHPEVEGRVSYLWNKTTGELTVNYAEMFDNVTINIVGE